MLPVLQLGTPIISLKDDARHFGFERSLEIKMMDLTTTPFLNV
jgi:hypothetical protein